MRVRRENLNMVAREVILGKYHLDWGLREENRPPGGGGQRMD